MQMKYKVKISLVLMFIFSNNIIGQVTIGSSEAPAQGALLQLKNLKNVTNDLNNADKGLMLPRVELVGIQEAIMKCGTDQTDFTTNKGAHIGLVVYNLTNQPNINLCPGMYVWTNGDKWVRLQGNCTAPCQAANSDNSFIVESITSDPLLIPVGKPYIVWKERTDLGNKNIQGKVSVSLLWQDTPSLIKSVELADGDKGACSQIKVSIAGNGTLGNALVAVHIGDNGDKNDPIYWSWHVWVSDNIGSYTSNNGDEDYIFMDRNLGAVTTSQTPQAMGMMYQWGRKDPFTASLNFTDVGDIRSLYDIQNNILTEVDEYDPATPNGTGIHHKEVTESNNLINSIKNPSTFYFGAYNNNSQENADWYTINSTGDDSLWSSTGDKSPFDPCPAGWRIPSYSAGDKSPWFPFEVSMDEAIEDGGFSSFNDKGAILKDSNSNLFGYYPYGKYRKARAYYSASCGYVGSGPGSTNMVGGLFSECLSSNQYQSLYWVANPITNTNNAKGLYFYYTDSGLMDGGSLYPINISKATGGSVRCVKIK